MKKQSELSWKWTEGLVNTQRDHIKIMYGKKHAPVALVAPSQTENFVVQFLKEAGNGNQETRNQIKQEIDSVLSQKKKKDPWGYAILRCCFSSSHSSFRWGYYPKK